MSLDIVEIALDGLSDHVDFEKLASEIMRDEGYPSIKPLGGVVDEGQDAIEETCFLSEGRTRVVFQYTLQQYLPGKVEDTIASLSKAGIEYHELVIVTPRSISTKRQSTMIRDVRKAHGVNLNIFERKTLVNRLADYETGIFHRHFPDIEKQVVDLSSKQPLLSSDGLGLLESSMLKASIAFTFSKPAPRVRKSIFDFLTLSLLLENPSEDMPIASLHEQYRKTVGGKQPPDAQIEAALQRLMSRRLVKRDAENVGLTDLAIETIASSTIQANESTDSLVSDIVDDVLRVSGKRLAEQDMPKLARNTRDVLVRLFQLFGIELANQVLRDTTPSPAYLDSSEDLIATAKRQLSPELGEVLISVISQTLKRPTDEQAQTLANWALAYIGVETMNLDPYLKEFQATRFADKMFILDTDVILDCVVQECPRSTVYLNLINALSNLGCKVIIPECCVDECIDHARRSPRTYKYFGEKLLSLGDSYVEAYVGNVFVKGYYHGRLKGSVSARMSFQQYLQNYHEASTPIRFFHEVLQTVFPSEVEVLNPTELLTVTIPEHQMSAIYAQLLELLLKSPKSEYRSSDQNKELAKTDARLFLTALYLNGEAERSSRDILGGRCYLITESGRYLRSAKAAGLQDRVTARPQSLIALLDLIGGVEITPTEFVSLFENPLLIYAVSQSWDDVQVLLESGVVLQGRSIARLRWDLEEGLHEQIATFAQAEARAESDDDTVDPDIGDNEYIELLKSTASRGYRRIPELDGLLEAVEKAQDDARARAEALDELLEKHQELEKEIAYFGKRRQRYLRRIGGRSMKE